jgi:hypothetical protein
MLLTLTVPLSLFVTVIVFEALVVPTVCVAKVRLVGTNVSGNTEAPDSPMICWLIVALSLTVSEPLAVPTMLGVNVTPMTQVAAGTKLAPVQVFELTAKFPLIGNEEPIVTETLLLFFTVTVFGALVVPLAWPVNDKLAGEKSSGDVPAPAPVPESPNSCGLAVELVVVTSVPAVFPFATGVKVIETVQVPLPASKAPQVVALMA